MRWHLGNLVVWWPAVGLAVASVAGTVWLGARTLIQAEGPAGSNASFADTRTLRTFLLTHGRACCLVLGQAVGFMLPWVLTRRDSYSYHFLPTYALSIVLLAGFLAFLAPRLPRGVLLFLCAVTLCGLYYAPVWSFMPLSEAAYRQRLFLETWR